MSYPLYPADPTRDPAEPFQKLDTAPTAVVTPLLESNPDPWDAAEPEVVSAEQLAARQRDAFGGPKVGSAFFGWLVAVSVAGILVGLLVVADAVLGLEIVPDPWASGGIGPLDTVTLGWIVVGGLYGIVFTAFACGGYVTGRMARFNGVAQGVVVWLWAVVVAVGAGVLAAFLVDTQGILDVAVGAAGRAPLDPELLSVAGVVAAVLLLAVSLGGAILGGVLGVRYHRRVDRAGFDV